MNPGSPHKRASALPPLPLHLVSRRSANHLSSLSSLYGSPSLAPKLSAQEQDQPTTINNASISSPNIMVSVTPALEGTSEKPLENNLQTPPPLQEPPPALIGVDLFTVLEEMFCIIPNSTHT